VNISDLTGLRMPDIRLPSTAGGTCNLGNLPSHAILIFLPFILPPEESATEKTQMDGYLTTGFEQLLGFVMLHQEFASRGIGLYGISTQSPLVQRLTVEALALPFPLLSDSRRTLCHRLKIPMIHGAQMRIPRVAPLVIQVRDRRVAQVFCPTASPHYCATRVLHQVCSIA
jgi:peroxiredoxin